MGQKAKEAAQLFYKPALVHAPQNAAPGEFVDLGPLCPAEHLEPGTGQDVGAAEQRCTRKARQARTVASRRARRMLTRARRRPQGTGRWPERSRREPRPLQRHLPWPRHPSQPCAGPVALAAPAADAQLIPGQPQQALNEPQQVAQEAEAVQKQVESRSRPRDLPTRARPSTGSSRTRSCRRHRDAAVHVLDRRRHGQLRQRPALPPPDEPASAARRGSHRGDAQLLLLPGSAAAARQSRPVRGPRRGGPLPLERRPPAGPDRHRRQADSPATSGRPPTSSS